MVKWWHVALAGVGALGLGFLLVKRAQAMPWELQADYPWQCSLCDVGGVGSDHTTGYDKAVVDATEHVRTVHGIEQPIDGRDFWIAMIE